MNKIVASIFVVMCVISISYSLPLDEKPAPVIREIRPAVLPQEVFRGQGLEGQDEGSRQKRHFYGGTQILIRQSQTA